jgi:hypothetical protein
LNWRIVFLHYVIRGQESEIARQHTKALEQQLMKAEQGKLKDTQDSKRKKIEDNDDVISQGSFKSAHTGFTGNTAMENQAKITKESIIYQKYV